MPHRKIIREWLLPLSQRSTLRAFVLVLIDTALFLGLVAGTVVLASVWLKLLCGLAAGFVIGRLFIIGHDACHQSLTPHRELNKWIGRYAFLYSLTPFSLWDTGHNVVHHGYTNLKGVDFVWTPLTAEEFADTPSHLLQRQPVGHSFWRCVDQRHGFCGCRHKSVCRAHIADGGLGALLVLEHHDRFCGLCSPHPCEGVLAQRKICMDQSATLCVHHRAPHLPDEDWQLGAPHHGAHSAPRGHEHSALPSQTSASQIGRNAARSHHCSAILMGLVLQNCQGLQALRLHA